MSGLTPRRIRTKTSDFTEFFRTGNSSSSSRHPDNDVSSQSQATTYTLDVPSTSSLSPGLTKKRSSKIPFLGRSRKKSNPDTGASYPRESTDVGEQSSGSTDRRLTVEIAEPPPLPQARLSVVSPSPSKPPSQSLGSKLAAHFQPRTRKLSALGSKPAVESISNNSLAPPESSTRGASLDSGSSGGRSPTPRAQPTITVSLSPDNLDEYKDLFTLPRKKKIASPDATPRQSNTPESDESSRTPTTTARTPSPTPISSELPRRGSAPTVLDGSRHHRSSKNPIHEQYPKPPPKPSSRKTSSAEKGSQESGTGTTPRSSDGKDSTRSSLSDKLSGPSLQRPVSVTPSTPAADYSAQQRLRMRQQLQSASPAPSVERRNRPPSMPLPSTPKNPPSPKLPSSSPPISRTSSTTSVPVPVPKASRPRASTVGSVSSIASSPLSQSNVPPDNQSTPLPESRASSSEFPVDLDLATPDQLREALSARSQQYDELAAYVLTVTEKHSTEKAALEKKISQLEREMSKKDNQIKGLMWLVANNKSPPATDFPPNLTLPALPSTKTGTDQEPQKIVSRMPLRRHHFSDDSGAESHPTSGAESIRTSETSGNESGSYRRSKGRRPFMLGDSSYNFYRATIGKRIPPPNSLAPDSALPELPNGRRSSLTSASPSPSSSTSSLLPPSPSVTVSSLSAIPEAPSAYPSSMTKSGDSTDGQEDKRATRAAHRISSSSMASSSTAASSAYASNLKRSRPPSIAQVLENSPNMDDVLEKLRPFQPQPT